MTVLFETDLLNNYKDNRKLK